MLTFTQVPTARITFRQNETLKCTVVAMGDTVQSVKSDHY